MRDEPRNPAALYVESLAPGSRQTMKQSLNTIARLISRGKRTAASLDWGSVGPVDTERVRAKLIELYSPATGRKMLAALRGAIRMAWRIGLFDAERRERIIDFSPIRGRSAPPGRALSEDEITALFAVCDSDDTAAGLRDSAIVVLLFFAGLRRTEASDLTVSEVRIKESEIVIRSGKGRRGRRVPVSQTAIRRLEDWLDVRGRSPGRFLRQVARGNIKSEPLGGTGIQRAIARRAEEALIERVLPHDLRRTFVTQLLEKGADLHVVQQLAGHENPSTTAEYDMRDFHAQRAAVEKLTISTEDERHD